MKFHTEKQPCEQVNARKKRSPSLFETQGRQKISWKDFKIKTLDKLLSQKQCCRSVTFWYGSGSADPTSDKLIQVQLRILPFSSVTFKMATKNIYFFLRFLLITFWSYIYIIFQRLKVTKKSQNSRNQCFSSYFGLMIKGSESGSMILYLWVMDPDQGGPKTYGSYRSDPQHCL